MISASPQAPGVKHSTAERDPLSVQKPYKFVQDYSYLNRDASPPAERFFGSNPCLYPSLSKMLQLNDSINPKLM